MKKLSRQNYKTIVYTYKYCIKIENTFSAKIQKVLKSTEL